MLSEKFHSGELRVNVDEQMRGDLDPVGEDRVRLEEVVHGYVVGVEIFERLQERQHRGLEERLNSERRFRGLEVRHGTEYDTISAGEEQRSIQASVSIAW